MRSAILELDDDRGTEEEIDDELEERIDELTNDELDNRLLLTRLLSAELDERLLELTELVVTPVCARLMENT